MLQCSNAKLLPLRLFPSYTVSHSLFRT